MLLQKNLILANNLVDLKNLKEIGVLRQLSAIFDTRKLGYTSSLVAMEIEHDELDHVASQINRHPGVSHNYERDHEFNLWFTLAVPPGADLNDELEKFNVLKGIKKVRMLPTLQLFKIDYMDLALKEAVKAEEKKEIKNIEFKPFDNYGKVIPGLSWYLLSFSLSLFNILALLKMKYLQK